MAYSIFCGEYQSTDLPVHPLQDAVLAGRIGRQQFAGFLGEILQDRAGLEHRDARFAVNHGGHLVVRADREEFGLELIALVYVDGNYTVREASLLEEDRDFLAIARGPEIQVDQVGLLRRDSPESIVRRAVVKMTGSAMTCRNQRNAYPKSGRSRRCSPPVSGNFPGAWCW
jgi:hypothetical protein